MDQLWTPWRYTYIKDAAKKEGCVFCDALALGDDARALIVHRAQQNFVILNRFPYTNGHVMIVPYDHVADLAHCDPATLAEMMALSRRMEIVLGEVYRPEGMNLGMNLGRCAGAGVVGHLHLHVVPRWTGDTNFMAVTAETRIHPEELAVTFQKLRAALSS